MVFIANNKLACASRLFHLNPFWKWPVVKAIRASHSWHSQQKLTEALSLQKLPLPTLIRQVKPEDPVQSRRQFHLQYHKTFKDSFTIPQSATRPPTLNIHLSYFTTTCILFIISYQQCKVTDPFHQLQVFFMQQDVLYINIISK